MSSFMDVVTQVSTALASKFNLPVYYGEVPSTATLPLFYIDITSAEKEPMVGIERYIMNVKVQVSYIHEDITDYKTEILNIQTQLYEALKTIVFDSKSIRGKEISNSVSGDILRYVISYPVEVQGQFDYELMENITINGV